uniref:transposase n=1 Tax=Acetobacter orientalis TaxID=146474 RepID=UPI00343A1186
MSFSPHNQKTSSRKVRKNPVLSENQQFEILPRRWVVERTFGWIIRWRRLVKDYEQRIDVAEAMIHIAMGSLMLRRNAHP